MIFWGWSVAWPFCLVLEDITKSNLDVSNSQVGQQSFGCGSKWCAAICKSQASTYEIVRIYEDQSNQIFYLRFCRQSWSKNPDCDGSIQASEAKSIWISEADEKAAPEEKAAIDKVLNNLFVEAPATKSSAAESSSQLAMVPFGASASKAGPPAVAHSPSSSSTGSKNSIFSRVLAKQDSRQQPFFLQEGSALWCIGWTSKQGF